MTRTHLLTYFLLAACLVSCLMLREPHDVPYREKEFNALATEILQQNEVAEMDDLTRYYKSINGIAVTLPNTHKSPTPENLAQVTTSLQLNYKIVSALREKLERTKLREFIKSGDTVLFIADGFLDDSWGFIYTVQDSPMDTTWFRFKGYSVKFTEAINSHWKRTAIR